MYLVWWRRPNAPANMFFALSAVATAVYGGCELWMMRAETPGAFGMAVRWTHVHAWVLIVSLVGFVRVYLRVGRLWLAWTVCGLRTLSFPPRGQRRGLGQSLIRDWGHSSRSLKLVR